MNRSVLLLSMVCLFILSLFISTTSFAAKAAAPAPQPNKAVPNVKFPQSEPKLQSAIDVFEVQKAGKNTYVKIEGWSVMPGVSSDKTDKRMVVLESVQEPKLYYVFETEGPIKRPGLTQALSAPGSTASEKFDYDLSGFTSLIDPKTLKDGEYKAGVMIKKANGEVFFSPNISVPSYGKNKVLVKKGNTVEVKDLS